MHDRAPKEQLLPGTSQAPGPRGRDASGKRVGPDRLRRRGKPGPPGVNLSGARGVRAGTEGEGSRARPLRAAGGPRARPPSLTDLERGIPFADRHIGPRPAELETDARRHRRRVARRAGRRGRCPLASAIPSPCRRRCPRRRPRPRRSTSCARSPRATRVTVPMIGLGYHGTGHPARHPPQRAGEPGLVHRVHAVPARDQPGPAGGAADVPDRGRRPHRPPGRRRVPARRGHRRGRGHDAAPPGRPREAARGSSSTPTPCRRPSRVLRTRAEPLGIELVVADLADGLPEGELFGLLLSYPGASGRGARPVPR